MTEYSNRRQSVLPRCQTGADAVYGRPTGLQRRFPCQRTQYAGVSTDKFTVHVKLLQWRFCGEAERPAAAAVFNHSLTSH